MFGRYKIIKTKNSGWKLVGFLEQQDGSVDLISYPPDSDV
jgi:hypothetical protein